MSSYHHSRLEYLVQVLRLITSMEPVANLKSSLRPLPTLVPSPLHGVSLPF
jgi:hypothetical protein